MEEDRKEPETMPRKPYFVLPIKGGYEIRSREEGRVGFSPFQNMAEKWKKHLNGEKDQ